jgi:cytochrome c biogenesis protein ResB
MQDGVVLQELPFDVELRKFIVDYYETGMPKLFASEIVIHDHETGAATSTTVKVNEPAFHRGVAIYQSSFDDGGSTVKLRAYPMLKDGKDFDVEGIIGSSTTLSNGDARMTLEFTGLRVINVENLSGRRPVPGRTCARSTSWPAYAINWAPVQSRTASANCATWALRSATNCATRQDKLASTTTTCCRSSSMGNACTSSEPETTRTTACATCASPRTMATASLAGCACVAHCSSRV